MASVVFDKETGINAQPPLTIAATVAEKPFQRLVALLAQWDEELGNMIANLGDGEVYLRPFLVVLDVLETLSEAMPKAFKLLIKEPKLPLKKPVEALYYQAQQFIYHVGQASKIAEDDEEIEVSAPLPGLQLVSALR